MVTNTDSYLTNGYIFIINSDSYLTNGDSLTTNGDISLRCLESWTTIIGSAANYAVNLPHNFADDFAVDDRSGAMCRVFKRIAVIHSHVAVLSFL